MNTSSTTKRHRRTKSQIAKDNATQKRSIRDMAAALSSFFAPKRNTAVAEESLVVEDELWNHIHRRDEALPHRRRAVDETYGDCSYSDSDDDDSNSGSESDEDEDEDEVSKNSVMTDYMKAVQAQLIFECKTKTTTDPNQKFLLKLLMENNFWLRKERCFDVCQKLNINPSLSGYYRDLLVWIPDEQHHIKLPCPTCHSSEHTAVHGYSKKSIARRIIGMSTNYYIMSRRYICHACRKDGNDNYTFRGYNEESMKRLPMQLSLTFPAMLTHKLGIDKMHIDLMRPLFDAGIKPNKYCDTVAELHHKEHDRLALLHEHSTDGKYIAVLSEREMFSSFSDKQKYDGYVPSAKWFRRCYSKYMKSIREFQDNELKQREVDIAKIDVQFKSGKKVKPVNGQKVINGTVTIMNQCGEIRSQWWITTDSQDQYITPITSMLDTFKQLGQSGPRLVYVDNPSQTGSFLLEQFPSLQRTQDEYDKIANSPIENSDDPINHDIDVERNPNIPDFDEWFTSDCTYLSSYDMINTNAAAVLDILDLDSKDCNTVIGYDAEWIVPSNEQGNFIGGSRQISLIQIAYNDGNIVKVVLYHVHGFKRLPPNLCNLLQHEKLCLAGCQVGGDILKTNRDFNLNIDKNRACVELANMALARGICLSSRGLDSMAMDVLGLPMDKGLRISNWGRKPLSEMQQKYAAKDAHYSLLLYNYLKDLPDLTLPISSSDVVGGLEVDICPYLSSSTIFNNGCFAATGKIVSHTQSWIVPPTLKTSLPISSGSEKGYYLVEILTIVAPSLKLKSIYLNENHRRLATLGDVGEGNHVMLPLAMLRKKSHTRKALLLSDRVKQRNESFSISKSYPKDSANTPLVMKTSFPDIYGTFADEIDESDDEIENLECNDGQQLENNQLEDNQMNITELNSVAEIEACIQLSQYTSERLLENWEQKEGILLDPPPPKIIDKFSAVLGSGFHAAHRIVTPVHHAYKKAYSVALSEAIYCWDESDMRTLVQKLSTEKGLEEDEIRLMRYFRRSYFTKRVRRHCLRPSRLYWRVRAVFETYGCKMDPTTRKPLFDESRWKKANIILKEILKGYYSDPPDECLYKYQLTSKGDIKRDGLGIPLLHCNRDTNDLEGEHSNISDTFGSHCVGMEHADDLIAERRHRCTINASKRNRLHYPHIKHYDTWIIDALQNVVERNHNMLLYNHWISASEFAKTEETFGFVTLSTTELRNEINEKVKLPDDYKMPRSLKFLSDQTGFIIAPQPWSTEKEIREIFPKLLLQAQQKHPNDEHAIDEYICHAIIPYVDGKHVTPKLPVYCRIFRKRHGRNQLVREAAKSMVTESRALLRLNEMTAANNSPPPNIEHETFTAVPAVTLPSRVANIANTINFQPFFGEIHVGGVSISRGPFTVQNSLHHLQPPRPPPRGKDIKKRKRRTCKTCHRYECEAAKPGPIKRICNITS